MYQPGNRVIKSCASGLIFHGKVIFCINPVNIDDYLQQAGISQLWIDQFDRRDPTWREFPIYLVQPDSSPGLAPFEEAQFLIPGLTEDMYARLTKSRQYILIDSDLLPEETGLSSGNITNKEP